MQVSMIATAVALLLLIPAPVNAAVDARRLEHLLTQDCGACHGLYLTGGLGPPLTPQALAGHSRDSLIATVTHGRPTRAMPGWAPLLSASEIAWLVDRLLQGSLAP
ncbi:cytochrome c [Pseudomonas sp. 18.1.10]|uniref:c-type cytochrome n=1 Tax=Pseudomonas sp. 18.1.10 TaxID=2969302 RepID=UPI0027E3AC72|nr:cytochrome c [Pseudomonas sp. 18.1.10]